MKIFRSAVLFAAASFAANATAQMVMPGQTYVYNGVSRGFSTIANTNFTITGLSLPVNAYQPGSTASYLVRVNGAIAFHSYGNPGAVTTNVAVAIGDTVAVLGNWSTQPAGYLTAHNSYAAGGGTYVTNINGVAHTLWRAGQQWDVGDPAFVGTYAFEQITGNMGRVEMYTNGTPPQGSVWESLFVASGAIGPGSDVELEGGAPPVLGTTTALDLHAPGFDFGFVAIANRATAGTEVSIGPDVLNIYLDLFGILGTYALPLTNGQTSLPLALPNNPALSGLDLAFQAVALNAAGALAGSNLVCGNFGMTAGGAAVFSFQYGGQGGLNVPTNEYWPSTAKKNHIVNNKTAAAKDYTICGERAAGTGILEIRDQTGAVLDTFPANQIVIQTTLTVPAGSKLYFYNNSARAIAGLKWTIKVG